MVAIHPSPSTCCRAQLPLRLLTQNSRPFTTSPARRKHGPLPTFHPTPSADLDALLSTFRSNVFLPAHLIAPQRALLYAKKHHSLLTSDEPATVRLGTEVHQLHPLSHIHSEPKTRSSFAKIIALMASINDFRNLPAFLEGLKTSRRSIKSWQMQKMVRRAVESGRLGVVHDCLRRVEGTGVGLWDLKVAREVMWGAVARCVQAGWGKEGLERGVKFADDVWALMFDAKHSEKMVGEQDAKRRPEVLGVLVLLHALRAVLYGEGRDDGGKVERFAGLMVARWENSRDEMVVDEGDWNDANYKLLMWAPIWHGMLLASNVLGSKSPLGQELLSKRTRGLEPLVQKALAVLSEHAPEEGKRRGLKMYEELIQVSV